MRFGLHYLAATALAVEAAVLHNFVWHERWTWADRLGDNRTPWARLARFHLVNGGVSLAGNLALMPLLVHFCGVPAVPANAVAVVACAAVNFAGADRFVFSHTMGASGNGEEASRCA